MFQQDGINWSSLKTGGEIVSGLVLSQNALAGSQIFFLCVFYFLAIHDNCANHVSWNLCTGRWWRTTGSRKEENALSDYDRDVAWLQTAQIVGQMS